MTLIKLNPNCHVLKQFNDRLVLFSYETPVAAYVPGEGFYRTEKKHSATTSKHINAWLLDVSGDVNAEPKPQAWFDSL